MIKRVSLFPIGILKIFKNLNQGGTETLRWKTRKTPWLGVSVVQILFLILLLIPSIVVFASSLNETRINISLSNSKGQPLSDVQISLDLYFYEIIAADQLEVRGAFSDECTTDVHGECTILIGETQDLLLRGSLDLGEYGSRNMEWHGGELDVPIRIEQAALFENSALDTPIRIMIYSAILFVFGTLGVIVQHKRVHA